MKNRKIQNPQEPKPFNWRSDSGLFGYLHRARGEYLELSRHSLRALARENVNRLRADLIARIEAAGVGFTGGK